MIPEAQIPNLDALYRRYLPETGYLVEVGAYDGVSYSNTLHLLKQGWKGLYIEPVREYAELCRKNLAPYAARVVETACGDSFGLAEIEVRGEYSCMGETIVASWIKPVSGTRTVTVKTLDEVIKFNGLPSVDLLVIDVEGYEKQVLNGFTLNGRKSPYMVIIELHELSDLWAKLPGHQAAINAAYAKFRDYKVVYKDDINTVFAK